MPDLDVQIRAYIDAASKPLTVDDVLEADAPRQVADVERRGDGLMADYLQQRPEKAPPTEPGRWRGAVIAAAAAVLVVVGVVVVADGDDSEVATEPAASPAVNDPPVSSPGVAEPVVPPSVFDSVSSYRWSLVAVGCCYGGGLAARRTDVGRDCGRTGSGGGRIRWVRRRRQGSGVDFGRWDHLVAGSS